MKYKVGDKVRIKSKEWWDAQPKNTFGNVEQVTGYFTKPMTEYCGRTATINGMIKGYYLLDIDDNTYAWGYETIEGLVLDNPEKSILSEEMIKDIAEVVKKNNLGVCVSENDGKLIIEPLKVEEEDLPIDTIVFVSDGSRDISDFHLRYYAGNKTTFPNGLKSTDHKDCFVKWEYIIEFSKFDPNNIEESLKYNIVK